MIGTIAVRVMDIAERKEARSELLILLYMGETYGRSWVFTANGVSPLWFSKKHWRDPLHGFRNVYRSTHTRRHAEATVFLLWHTRFSEKVFLRDVGGDNFFRTSGSSTLVCVLSLQHKAYACTRWGLSGFHGSAHVPPWRRPPSSLVYKPINNQNKSLGKCWLKEENKL